MDRVLETQMDDEETQELIEARNDGKKKASGLENQMACLCK